MFYIGIVVLVLLAMLFVFWPVIIRQRATASHQDEADMRQSANVVLYQDHLQELEASVKAGNVSQEQYEQLKAEMERNLLEDNQTSEAEASVSQRKQSISYTVIAGVAMFVLVVSGVVYYQLGAYQSSQVKAVLDQRTEMESRYIQTGDKALEARIVLINQSLTEKLTAYLEQRPDDLQMRVLLARTYMGLGNYPRAISQFQAVLEQEPELSQIVAETAQAVFLQADNRVVPIVQTLVERALSLDPQNTIALGLAGISAFHQQQYQQAITFWEQAVQIQGPNNPNSVALQSGIQAAKQRLAAAPASANPQAVTAPQATAEQTSPAESQVKVAVSLGQGIEFSPDDTVFIYARAWQGARVPLSIARVKASQLPLTLSLTNSMSMAPGMNLNSAEELELVARLSKGGDPVPQSGDWQVTLGPVTLANVEPSPYALVIADQIP